jgi:pimeloyl-ACP methyl ester carboxylesterase
MSRISAETREAQIELTRWRHDQDQPDRAFVDATRSLVQWLRHPRTIETHIRRVQAPTLLVHGDHDRLVSMDAAAAVASLRPDWSFRVLANTGHIPQLERPESFVDVVEGWLGARQPAELVSTSRR